jgi:hypothetical protein
MDDKLFTAEQITEGRTPPPPRPEMFMLLAAHNGYWCQRGPLMMSEGEATLAAEHLSSHWSHWQVYRIPAFERGA